MKRKTIVNWTIRIGVLLVTYLILVLGFATLWQSNPDFWGNISNGKMSFNVLACLLVVDLLIYLGLSYKFDKGYWGFWKISYYKFKDLLSEVFMPFRRLEYIIGIVILFWMIFGFQISNFTLSLDEELQMAEPKSASQWCYEGRFTISFFKGILMENGMFQPFLSNFVGAILLIVAGVLMCYFIRTNICTRKDLPRLFDLVFIGGFASFPSVIAESQSFSTYCIEIAFGYCIVAVSAIMFAQWMKQKDGVSLFWNVIMLSVALGIYQAMVGVYITLILIYFLLKVYSEPNFSGKRLLHYLKWMFLSIVILIASLGVWGGLYLLATTLHQSDSSMEYIADFTAWDMELGVLGSLKRSFEAFGTCISQIQVPGIKYFWIYLILASVLAIVILILQRSLKAVVCAILMLLVGLSSFIMWFSLAAVSLPFRAWLSAAVVSGFVYVMAIIVGYDHFHKAAFVILFVVISVVLFRQIQTVNQLFYNDHIRMEKDVKFAEELYYDISRECGRPSTETAIVFVGSVDLADDESIIKNPTNNKFWGGDCLGYSMWRRAQDPRRMKALYRDLGYTLNINNCTDNKANDYIRSELNVYPQKGSIRVIDGVVYVRLN